MTEGFATYNASASSLTEIFTGSTLIGYEFKLALKLGFQVKQANDPTNSTTGAYNDQNSWNAEVVASDGVATTTLQTAVSLANSAGPRYAGAVGTNAWTNAANAAGSEESLCAGDNYGTSIVSGFWNTFGFNIPTGSTIDGIQMEVKWSWDSDPPAAGDMGITVAKDETTLGTEQNFTTAEPAASGACGTGQEIDTKGGSTDLWGLTWTPAEINAGSFAVRVRKSLSGTEHGTFINWIRVTVYYTEGGEHMEFGVFMYTFVEISDVAVFHYIDPVEVTPATANAWTDVDVSAYIPAGSTGVLLHLENAGGADLASGIRKKGSTDSRTQFTKRLAHHWAAIGVDENRVFQAYVGSTVDINIFLTGYTTAGVTFFTNAVDKSLGTVNTWVDIDISADTGSDTATVAIIEVVATADRYYGFRKNGSTESILQDPVRHAWAIVEVDANETLEGQVEDVAVDFFLIGYTLNNDNTSWKVTVSPGQTANTNVVNVTFRSNADFILKIWFDTHLVRGGDTIDITNVQILAAADPNDNITADTAFAGLGESNAVFIYGTAS